MIVAVQRERLVIDLAVREANEIRAQCDYELGWQTGCVEALRRPYAPAAALLAMLAAGPPPHVAARWRGAN